MRFFVVLLFLYSSTVFSDSCVQTYYLTNPSPSYSSFDDFVKGPRFEYYIDRQELRDGKFAFAKGEDYLDIFPYETKRKIKHVVNPVCKTGRELLFFHRDYQGAVAYDDDGRMNVLRYYVQDQVGARYDFDKRVIAFLCLHGKPGLVVDVNGSFAFVKVIPSRCPDFGIVSGEFKEYEFKLMGTKKKVFVDSFIPGIRKYSTYALSHDKNISQSIYKLFKCDRDFFQSDGCIKEFTSTIK